MTTPAASSFADLPLEEIARAVRQIRYGSVEIVIHDSRIVQIERREKVRFDKSTGSNGTAHHAHGCHDPHRPER
ncbi:MAG: YezD family protein [Deltaproteobacteria bacterium]|nr:YezD family protein [Deltaproteobacteria bacterium]